MSDDNNDTDDFMAQLSLEFIESAQDHLEDIEKKLDALLSNSKNYEVELQGIQRQIHSIKGQGATFGFPLTGRVAHMLEDYFINANEFQEENIKDIRRYLGLMADLISSGESLGDDDPEILLKSLPTGHVPTFSSQKPYDINVLLVMPPGLQRKLVAKELVACGFRIMRAYDSIEALAVAIDIRPDVVFVNYNMEPFNGLDLSKAFAAIKKLRDIHFVLLTSYESGAANLATLPKSVSVVHKHKDFMDDIGELLIEWGMFGDLSSK